MSDLRGEVRPTPPSSGPGSLAPSPPWEAGRPGPTGSCRACRPGCVCRATSHSGPRERDGAHGGPPTPSLLRLLLRHLELPASPCHLLRCVARVRHEVPSAVCVIRFAVAPTERTPPLWLRMQMYANTGRRQRALRGGEEAAAGRVPPPSGVTHSGTLRPPLGHSCQLAVSCAHSGSCLFFSFSHLQSKFVYCNFFFW